MIGCADMGKIDGADVVRDKDVSTVSCRGNTKKSWKLTCNITSGEWEGEYGICAGMNNSMYLWNLFP